MSFPLFHRPGAVVFLDDDPDYLEMLALVLPRQWHVELFVRPLECINYLQQEPPFWEADAWNQQQLVEHWRAGKPLIPQILGYWSKYTERFALTRVCVVDYSMPGMDGLQALGELLDWPGSRVVGSVVLPSARLAPCLPGTPRRVGVKLFVGLLGLTPAASRHP